MSYKAHGNDFNKALDSKSDCKYNTDVLNDLVPV